MTAFMCGATGADWPETPTSGLCCIGSAMYGPERCTCWEPVYDLEQVKPRPDLPADVRSSMCHDCAYRPGSPERSGDPRAAGTEEALRALVDGGDIFWCHQGIRRPIRFEHPSGITVPGSDLAYDPPIIDGTPYRANGTPADMCGGWAALRLKIKS